MKVTDLNYALEDKLIKRLDRYADMVTRKKQIQDVLFCVHGRTGCLSGDSVISIHRNEVGRKYKIKYLYEAINGKPHAGRKWNMSHPIFVRSFNGKIIRLNKMKHVFYSGVKDVFKITLENGLSIKATEDHKFLTKQNEWIELSKLTGKEIMCDTLNAESSNRKRIKLRDIGLNVGNNHPFNIQPNGQIPVHILIYEANLNNMGLTEYLDILLNEPERCKSLKYIDPKIYVIHHKDGCHYNNSIENLQLLKREEHCFEHNLYTNFSQGIPKFSKVLSIEHIGKEDTYDIECEEHHNFVANGIIVHNSGKTNAALVMSYYLKSKTGFPIHLFFRTSAAVDFAKATIKKIIIIDEPSLESMSKDQMSKVNKDFMRLLNTMRQKRHILIVNITRFWRFPFDLVVDRSLAMINVFNKGGKIPGRFHFIRQKRLEYLWNEFARSHKKVFTKVKSFGGGFPERMEKEDKDGIKFFDKMGIIINGKPNCNYIDYKEFRDLEISKIGEINKQSKKEIKILKTLHELQFKITRLYKMNKITQVELAGILEINPTRLREWAKIQTDLTKIDGENEKKEPDSLEESGFESFTAPKLGILMDNGQENPETIEEAQLTPIINNQTPIYNSPLDIQTGQNKIHLLL